MHFESASTQLTIDDADITADAFGDAADECQSEARTRLAIARQAAKRLKNRFPIFRRDTGSIVFNDGVKLTVNDIDLHEDLCGRILAAVADQVSDRAIQPGSIN